MKFLFQQKKIKKKLWTLIFAYSLLYIVYTYSFQVLNVNILKKYMDILCETMYIMSTKNTLTSVKEQIS